ncbi:MAG: YlbF family regulator [Ruminococcaceae bacterium]|nr:YlbF family regulator [Oscillospiraceae bacterium]
MDVTELAKTLGEALTHTEQYKNYIYAKSLYEADTELEQLIEAYNMEKLRIDIVNNQGSEEDKKENSTDRLNQLYQQIMSRDAMLKYGQAHEELGKLMDDVNSIILQAMNGNDEGCTPDKCANCGHCNH